MNNSFFMLCVLSVVLAAFAIAGIAPLLWDAAGHIQLVLDTIATPEWRAP